MPNHYYVISEVRFFNDRKDENTWSFVADTGIDLNQDCHSIMPTLHEIKVALTELGFDTEQQNSNENEVEIKAIKEAGIGLWLLFTDVSTDSTPINMFEIGRGSDPELAIDFIKALVKTHGRFLYYFDGGNMSLVTADKEKHIIMQEMYS